MTLKRTLTVTYPQTVFSLQAISMDARCTTRIVHTLHAKCTHKLGVAYGNKGSHTTLGSSRVR
eukprot:2100055-Prymnesium_polylepis.1